MTITSEKSSYFPSYLIANLIKILGKQPPAYELLFEDEDLILINKSSGIPVLPERQNIQHICIKSLIEKRYGSVFIVHRIDKETSGVLCMAKNPGAHKALNQIFMDRQVEKKYLAIVEGKLLMEADVISLPIYQDRSGNRIDKKGKTAISHYQVKESFRHYSLLEIDIKTGRQHQIRLHMQAIGHPLMVDSLYGNSTAFMLSSVKKKFNQKEEEERPLLDRLSLHAYSLSFTHPFSGEKIYKEAPLPKDLLATLSQLRKWDS